MSPRITRSAARLAADTTTASTAASNPATTPSQTPRSSRKRKGTQRDSSPEATPEAKTTATSRRPKRPKLSDTEPPQAPQQQNTTRRTRKGQGKSTAMSAPGPSESAMDGDSAPHQNASSSKRKSSRNKKQSSATSPETPQAPKRQSKKSSKKSEDTSMPDADEAEKKEASETTAKNGGQDFSEEDNALAFRSHNRDEEDDEDDDEDDPFRAGFLGRGGPGSIAQTMRALGGMMSGSGTASRLREILENLRQKDDPSVQLVALNDLSQLLLVSTEDNLSGHFAPDQLVKELVPLMQANEFGEENPEMMLLACRCIANLMEALPPATASVVYGGAVPILCQKLLEIHFIDLAEQALSTLEKISVEFPASIVREGGLTACLTYLDFFATSTQRTAVTTAANCCRNIPEDSFGVVRDVMPILLNVLGSNDQRVVEQGSLCVSRVVESFKYHPDKLEDLVKPDLLKAILRLLLPGSTNLIGPSIHTQFLRVLSITARGSPSLSTELFKMDVIDTIYQILTGVSPPENTDDVASKIDGVVIMQALIHRPREQIFETLNLVCELLPGISKDSGATRSGYVGIETAAGASIVSKTGNNAKRLDLLQQCQDKVKRFATILLPTLTHAYSSTVNFSVRQKVLTAQLKMLSNLEVSILDGALRTVPFASYLASILSQQDHPALVTYALQAAELLIDRMAHVYSYQFYREGVFSEVSRISNKPMSEPKAKSAADTVPNKRSDSENVTSSRGQNGDGSTSDSDELDDVDEAVIEELQELDDEHDDEEEEDGDDDDDGDGDDGEEDEEDGVDAANLRSGEDGSRPTSATSSEQGLAASRPISVEDHVIAYARALFEKLQDAKSSEVRDKAEAILKDVKNLASKIQDCYAEGSDFDGHDIFKSLSSYFNADALNSITSAELLNSGLVDVLLEIFDDKNGSVGIEARASFLDAFMETIAGRSQTSPVDTTTTPFSVLVHKLQDLLSRAEHLEVITVHQNSFDSNRSSAASMLAKQLRLKLVADDDSEIPKSFRNIMVSIHAIATFKALDDYLRPRISLSDRPRSGRHHENLSSTLAAFAAATGGLPSHHQRLLERGLGLGSPNNDPSSIPAPPPPTTGPSSATKKTSARRSLKEKPSAPAAPQTPTSQIDKHTPSKRASRRHQGNSKPPIPEQNTSTGSQNPLECADERQLSDDDDLGEANPMDTFVDDLEDEMEDSHGTDPSAVNMEVASTGKVTARQEDGTRVPTPSQGSTSQSVPHLTPQARARGLMNTPSLAARTMSYAAAIQSTPMDWHIQFSIDDQAIPNDTTIYRAVHYNRSQPEELSTRNVWSAVHPIKFKRVSGPPPSESSALSPVHDKSGTGSDLPSSLHKHPETSKILRLLNTLHELNANVDEVLDDNVNRPSKIAAEPVGQFVNTKLTAKMNRQLEEPLIVASNCLPSWSEDLARLYPFLFPFETRHLFLQSTSFGYSRSMTRWQNAQSNDGSRHDRHRDDRPFLGRLQRQKVRISRSRILESAVKVMELYGSSPSVLEVEYFEEVGTGLGPTLEFYSTVSKEFSKKKSKMWRENESSSEDEYAFGKSGLFPAPMSAEQADSENGKKVLHLFKMLGKFVARSMLDSRIIDVSFNPVFFKDNRHFASCIPSLGVVRSVDTDLASSLKLIKNYAQLKKGIDDDKQLTKMQKADAARAIEIHGATVDDLGLDFTVPGYPGIELINNGSNVPVTIENVGYYLDRVLDYTLGSGVQRQIDAFRTGFSLVFPYSALKAFTPKELVMLFGRIEEDWTIETLMDSIKADHGFNMDSKSVRNLLQTMSELDPAQRRDFLQFVTGSPKLPIGGFKSLTPMFTVVCRPSEPPYTSDDYLPSVMTCVNYLKLPDYTDLDIMRTRLFTAIQEGQGAFHLS